MGIIITSQWKNHWYHFYRNKFLFATSHRLSAVSPFPLPFFSFIGSSAFKKNARHSFAHLFLERIITVSLIFSTHSHRKLVGFFHTYFPDGRPSTWSWFFFSHKLASLCIAVMLPIREVELQLFTRRVSWKVVLSPFVLDLAIANCQGGRWVSFRNYFYLSIHPILF